MGFPKRKNIKEEILQKLIIVGSKNPVKINCTSAGFFQAFNSEFLVEGLNIGSNVSNQPIGSEETYQGAFNRAKNAKNVFPEADFWVGIEGGIEKEGAEMSAFAWVVIMDKSERIGKSKTATFVLPDKIASMVNEGMELGEADDKFFDQQNSKQEGGSVGLLTKGAIPRKDYYQQAVVLALIPFLNEGIFH
jgi:inosine/xanthosine triphosphatase